MVSDVFGSLSHHDPDCVSKAQLEEDIDYKLSGSFMLTGGRQHGIFGTTDACGSFSLYGNSLHMMLSLSSYRNIAESNGNLYVRHLTMLTLFFWACCMGKDLHSADCPAISIAAGSF